MGWDEAILIEREFLRSTTSTHPDFLGKSFEVDGDLLLSMFDASSKKGIIGDQRFTATFSFGRHDELYVEEIVRLDVTRLW